MNNSNSKKSNNCPYYIKSEDFCFSDGVNGCTGKKSCPDYFIHELEREVKALFSKKSFLDGYELYPHYNSHYIKREEDIKEIGSEQ